MGRRWGYVGVGVCLGLLALGFALGQDGVAVWRSWGSSLRGGQWSFTFNGPTNELVEEGPFTGLAFGPGRKEIAYCAPAGRDGGSGLYVVSASLEFAQRMKFGRRKTSATPRLVCPAPEGVTLRGPVWWAPNGSAIALRACGEQSEDLVLFDYAAGELKWLTRGERVVDAAWHPAAVRIAYVTSDDGQRILWTRSLAERSPERLGTGGYDLRWSLDGGQLRWLSPASEAVWTQMAWDVGTAQLSEEGARPARPDGAKWSPDGRFCAVLEPDDDGEAKQIVIYRAGSERGEAPDLADANPRALLGWSPDSRLLLVLGDLDFLFAVSAVAPGDAMVDLIRDPSEMPSWRAAVVGYPIDPAAGAPSWSSDCDLLAYVVAKEFDERTGLLPVEGSSYQLADFVPVGQLVATAVGSKYLKPVPIVRNEVLELTTNLMKIGNCLQMYLADNNDTFSMAEGTGQLREVLHEYVTYRWDESVWMKPGSEDEVAVEYLIQPGTKLTDIENWENLPVAVIGYLPDYDIICYADGRVELVRKR